MRGHLSWRAANNPAPPLCVLPCLTAKKNCMAPANKLHRLSTSLGRGTVNLFIYHKAHCHQQLRWRGLSRWTGQPHRPWQGNQLAFGGPVLLSSGPLQPLHGCRGIVKVAACRLSHQIHQLRGVKAAFSIGLHPKQAQTSDSGKTEIFPPTQLMQVLAYGWTPQHQPVRQLA